MQLGRLIDVSLVARPRGAAEASPVPPRAITSTPPSRRRPPSLRPSLPPRRTQALASSGVNLSTPGLSKTVFEYGKGLADTETGKVKRDRCVLIPTGKFRLSWDMLLLVLLIYISIVTPYRIGFTADAEKFSPM